jgi:hypothetical protein
VSAGTLKFAGDLPVLIEKQPLRGPRDDGGGDELLRSPGHLLRVVEAKARVLWAVIVPINMGQQTLLLDRVCADDRIDDDRRDVGIFQRPAIEKAPLEENNPDAVGLRNGPDRSLPNPDPAGGAKEAKFWKIVPDSGVLLLDRGPRH